MRRKRSTVPFTSNATTQPRQPQLIPMNELIKYYSARLIHLAIGVAVFVVAIDQAVLPWLTKSAPTWVLIAKTLALLTSRLSIVAYLAGGEYLIRKHLWKWEKPAYDFSGMWDAETFYTKDHVGTGIVPFSSKHEVRIEQDCLAVRIGPTMGLGFVNWGSLALEIAEGNTLRYAYWVNYSDLARFPVRAKGYEEMKVTNYDTNGRPERMTGVFFHCAEGQSPVYSGTVEFRRRNGS
jgi:hypothetical protein